MCPWTLCWSNGRSIISLCDKSLVLHLKLTYLQKCLYTDFLQILSCHLTVNIKLFTFLIMEYWLLLILFVTFQAWVCIKHNHVIQYFVAMQDYVPWMQDNILFIVLGCFVNLFTALGVVIFSSMSLAFMVVWANWISFIILYLIIKKIIEA